MTLAALKRNRAARNRHQTAQARHDMRDWQVERRQRTQYRIEFGGFIVKSGIVDPTGDNRAMIYGALLWMAGKLRSDDGERARSLWAAKGKQTFVAKAPALIFPPLGASMISHDRWRVARRPLISQRRPPSRPSPQRHACINDGRLPTIFSNFPRSSIYFVDRDSRRAYDRRNPDDPGGERNDELLERIYIGRRFRNDTERLEKLFDLYTKMIASPAAAKKRRAGAA